jgi:phage shock protein PspC (stress-responsive transcriptional regulator)
MARSAPTVARDDTLLGACYAVGEKLGINPLCLRLLFAFAILWSPAVALTAYAALTAIVTLSRCMAPDPLFGRREARVAFGRTGEAHGEAQVELPLAA